MLADFFVADEQWKGKRAAGWDHNVPYYTPQIGKMECRDLRVNELPWTPVKIAIPPVNKELRKNPLPPMRQTVFSPDKLLVNWECETVLPLDFDKIPEALQTEKIHPLPERHIDGKDGKILLPGRHIIPTSDYQI